MAASKNGTFLFDRNYMDYHSDRFDDHSLMVFLNRRLFALLPGNRCGDTFISHQGLTYGGFVIDGRATAVTVGEAFACINDYLRSEGFRKVVYKPVPHIYHRYPADEDLYALFVTCRARLVERDASSTLLLSRRPKFAESRLSGVRKARRYGVTVGESTDVEVFWHILTASLHDRYGAKPVHTVDEMRLLKERFPEQIRLYMAFLDDKPVGGFGQQMAVAEAAADAQGGQIAVDGPLRLLLDRRVRRPGRQRGRIDGGRPVWQRQ